MEEEEGCSRSIVVASWKKETDWNAARGKRKN
jgi:hypothetical protein